MLLSRRPDRVPHRRTVGGMAPDLVAQLAGVSRARDHDRNPVVRPDAPDREAEPLEILERSLRRRRPHDLLQELTAGRSLDGDVVELLGRRLHPRLEIELLAQLVQPDAVVLVAADEAEVVLTEPVDRRVVDHPAGLVADRGVRDLADRETARVARDRVLDERFGVGAEDLPLAQRRQVHDRDLLAAGPVLGDRALVVEAVREPVAAVLDEALRQLARPRMERRLLREHRIRISGHTPRDRDGEGVVGRIDAHMDGSDLPAVRRVDVVGARRRCAHEVAHRAQEHVVAGARPRLVHDEDVRGVEARVVEEVERLPAHARRDPERRHLPVEVRRAVDVAGVALVLVVLGRAGQPERVVATDRVAHDLDQRILVDVVELPLEAGLRVRLPHERASRRRVEAALEARLELASMEREEVGALLALDVDHLDELTGAHLVGERRGSVDPEVEPWLRERRREFLLLVAARRRATHLDEKLGGRRRAVDDTTRRCRDDDRDSALRTERLRRPSRRPVAEQTDRERFGRIEAARPELVREQAAVAVGQRCVDHGRGGVRLRVERRGVVAPVRPEHGHLGCLVSACVDDRHALVRPEGEDRRAAGPDDVRLEERILREQPGVRPDRSDPACAAGAHVRRSPAPSSPSRPLPP